MDTNQQPKAAHLAQELKAGEWSPNILQNEVALRQCAAEELLRQHAEIETLRTGYNAARLEIESLQTRIQELGQQARECSDRKVVQLESALAMHVRSGKDWAMRVEALERTITTLRAHIASSNAQAAAAKKAMRELEAQAAAVGAGGVEPLRKRECLHQIQEPDHFRGATEMVTAARQPLDDKAILQGRTDGYDAEDPPEGWAFAQGVRFAERAHGITGEPQ